MVISDLSAHGAGAPSTSSASFSVKLKPIPEYIDVDEESDDDDNTSPHTLTNKKSQHNHTNNVKSEEKGQQQDVEEIETILSDVSNTTPSTSSSSSNNNKPLTKRTKATASPMVNGGSSLKSTAAANSGPPESSWASLFGVASQVFGGDAQIGRSGGSSSSSSSSSSLLVLDGSPLSGLEAQTDLVECPICGDYFPSHEVVWHSSECKSSLTPPPLPSSTTATKPNPQPFSFLSAVAGHSTTVPSAPPPKGSALPTPTSASRPAIAPAATSSSPSPDMRHISLNATWGTAAAGATLGLPFSPASTNAQNLGGGLLDASINSDEENNSDFQLAVALQQDEDHHVARLRQQDLEENDRLLQEFLEMEGLSPVSPAQNHKLPSSEPTSLAQAAASSSSSSASSSARGIGESAKPKSPDEQPLASLASEADAQAVPLAFPPAAVAPAAESLRCELCHDVIEFALVDGETSTVLDVYYLEVCTHVFCRSCIREHLIRLATQSTSTSSSSSSSSSSANMATTDTDGDDDELVTVSTMRCPAPQCGKFLAEIDVRTLLPQEHYDRLVSLEVNRFFDANSSNIVKCPQCATPFERDVSSTPSLSDQALKDQPDKLRVDGMDLSVAAFRHRELNRFRCRNCDVEFCAQCKRTPYHLGKTCEEFEQLQSAKRCRFCDSAVSSSSQDKRRKKSVPEVCSSEECQKRNGETCGKTLRCGHLCCGVKKERKCLPCLTEGCTDHEKATNLHQEAEDFCAICYVEPLKAAPCVQLQCSHVFHYHCVLNKLEKKWPGARITFGFMNCPTCSMEIKSDHPSLVKVMKELTNTREDLRKRARLRLEHEGLSTHSAITDKQSKFYDQPGLYAEHVLCYYPCFKCKKPYFGGLRNCANMAEGGGGDGNNAENNNNNAAAGGGDEGFNPQDLVCGACVPSGCGGAGPCKKHGTEFLEYKCRFCCSVATWFCFGTTHFCEACHKKQMRGDYVTKKKAAELPKCEGKAKCPLKIDHPPNGSEFALGCVVCRRATTDF